MKTLLLLSLLTATLIGGCTKEDTQPSNGNGGGNSNIATWHYCGAPTQNGTPCQRHVVGSGSEYCWQHK